MMVLSIPGVTHVLEKLIGLFRSLVGFKNLGTPDQK